MSTHYSPTLSAETIGQGCPIARRLAFMKTFRNNPELRLASINAQIDSLQTTLQGLVVDGRHHLLGPVETSFLEIEIAELRVEYNGLIAKLPM